MTIYEMCIDAITQNVPVYIDLVNKNLRIGKQKIIKKGNVTETFEDIQLILNKRDIDELYYTFVHSYPSQSSLCNKPYYAALPSSQLSDEEMVTSKKRDIAQVELEAYILLAFMNGTEKWSNPKHWFWRSNKHKDFFILSSWV